MFASRVTIGSQGSERKDLNMHKLAITLAATVMIAGGAAYRADATPLSSGLTPLTKGYSPVQNVYYYHHHHHVHPYYGHARRHARRTVRRCARWHGGACVHWVY